MTETPPLTVLCAVRGGCICIYKGDIWAAYRFFGLLLYRHAKNRAAAKTSRDIPYRISVSVDAAGDALPDVPGEAVHGWSSFKIPAAIRRIFLCLLRGVSGIPVFSAGFIKIVVVRHGAGQAVLVDEEDMDCHIAEQIIDVHIVFQSIALRDVFEGGDHAPAVGLCGRCDLTIPDGFI